IHIDIPAMKVRVPGRFFVVTHRLSLDLSCNVIAPGWSATRKLGFPQPAETPLRAVVMQF
ncbi:MAG TPA: hypothetical protein VN976_11560, partial [Verrucomicrobiae bacterium]|nr:hypothetical protein [Verrucomicrobiae bacterium]